MPTYCIREIKTGELHEVRWSFAEYDARRRKRDGAFRLDNGSHGFIDPVAQRTIQHRPGEGWPHDLPSAGVMPSQIKRAMEVDRTLGVPTDYTPDGYPIARSLGHQRDYVKAHHMVDYQDAH